MPYSARKIDVKKFTLVRQNKFEGFILMSIGAMSTMELTQPHDLTSLDQATASQICL